MVENAEANPRKFGLVVKRPAYMILFFVLALMAVFSFRLLRGKVVENFLSRETGGEVRSIDDANKSVVVPDEDGAVSYKEAKLPDTFPKDFPVYENSVLTGSWSNSGSEGNASSVLWETDNTVEKVISFYKEGLPDLSWEVMATFENQDSATLSFKKDEVSGMLGVTSGGERKKTSISVTFIKK